MSSSNQVHPPLLVVVDEDPGIRRALYRLFKRDFEVKSFANPKEILEVLEGTAPAAVITEYEFGGDTPAEMIEKLKKAFPYISVVVVTATADIEVVAQALQSGLVDRFFTKPWDDEALFQAVRSAIREKELARRNVELLEELERLVELRTRQLEKAKREWEVTFDAIGDPILILDEEMRIVRANKAAALFAERKIQEIPGRYCFEVLAGRSSPCKDCPVSNGSKEEVRKDVEIRGNICEVFGFPVKEEPLKGMTVVHCKCLK